MINFWNTEGTSKQLEWDAIIRGNAMATGSTWIPRWKYFSLFDTKVFVWNNLVRKFSYEKRGKLVFVYLSIYWFIYLCVCGHLVPVNRVSGEDTLQWRHNKHDGISNHQRFNCLLNHLFKRRSKKTSKLRVTGLCEGNPLVTGGFPSQRASNAENVSIWWRHRVIICGFMVESTIMANTDRGANEPLSHYCNVIMGAMTSQITSLTIVYSTVHSCTDQRKHQSSASLAFAGGFHGWPVNSPHKWPVTQKMFSFYDVIMTNPTVPYPTMHHFITKNVHCVTFVWCIVGFVRWDTVHSVIFHDYVSNIDDLVKDSSNPIVKVLELLQSCIKLSISPS